MESLGSRPPSRERDILLNNLSYTDFPYLICLSDYNRLLEAAGERCGSEGVCAVTEGLKKWAAQAVEALRTQAGHTLRPLDEVFVRENFPLQAEEPVWEENSQAWELVNTYVLSAIRAGLD